MRKINFGKDSKRKIPNSYKDKPKKITTTIEIDEKIFERMKFKAFLEVETIGDYIGRLVYKDTEEIKNSKELNEILNIKDQSRKDK